MEDDPTPDLIMTSALARTLAELVERLDNGLCDEASLAELRRLADRAESRLAG